MKKIFKYAIPIADEFELELPKGAEILTFQIQYEQPVIWAIVDPDSEKEKRYFDLYGTGHPMKEYPNGILEIDGYSLSDKELKEVKEEWERIPKESQKEGEIEILNKKAYYKKWTGKLPKYIGTAQMANGQLVWHLFERKGMVNTKK